MAMKHVTLRVWHPDCWMLEACERHRDLSIESRGVSCQGSQVHAGAILRSAHPAALKDALDDALPKDVRREVIGIDAGQAEVYSTYPAYRSLYEDTINTGFLVVAPIVHENGYERWDILADPTTLQQGIDKLRARAEVRVERIGDRRAPAAPPRDLYQQLESTLSPRQLEVLTYAVRHGYYDWPRGAGLQDIAKALGISAPTCLEHLRGAERRIVPSVLERLVRTDRATKPRAPRKAVK